MKAGGLRPFFYLFGGKWRSAPRYPAPVYGTVVEPFAGAAGYATRHYARRVVLYEADPVIAGVWDYLVRASESDVRSLPAAVSSVDSLPGVPQEARWLIGFWLNHAASGPRKTPSKWMRDGIRPNSFWGEVIRDRLANQVGHIRHWVVRHADFMAASGGPFSWFIDPPYHGPSGRQYRHRIDDYGALASWCRSRDGQVIVCERAGADWLPFEPLGVFKSTEGPRGKGTSAEVIWTGGGP